MRDAGTIAVWCRKMQPADNATFEAHFNYWRLAKTTPHKPGIPRKDFLDIGIQVSDPQQVDSVSIFLPIAHAEVSDLGPLFHKREIAEGIFNKLLDISTPHNGSWTDLSEVGGTSKFRVYKFADVSAEVVSKQEAGGTLVTIPRTCFTAVSVGLAVDQAAYFRLRVLLTNPDKDPFLNLVVPEDRLFLSGVEEMEIIDFRLNDSRTLPELIERQMHASTSVSAKLRKVAFLTAVPIASNLTMSHAELHRVRRLETKTWDDYVPNGIPPDMIVYHWSQSDAAGIEDFSAFVKLSTRRSDWRVWLPYAVLALVLGIFGNLIASGILALFGIH